MSPSVEPFNEAKYRALMDGLECSEINFKNAMICSYSSRLDSDFFKKDAIEFSRIAEGWDELSIICPNIKSGTTPAVRDENIKEGIALLKTNDIRNNVINPLSAEQFFYIDEQTNEKMKSTVVKSKDVLINIVGASTDVIGRVSFIPENFIKSNITQAMAILRIENPNYLPEYLFAFMLSNYARRQTNRISRQTGQYNMNLKEVGTYRIWKSSIEFQLKIVGIVNNANINQTKAQKLYQEAQEIILRQFSIQDDILCQNISIRSIVSSYKVSSRLDAEFYQPKYAEYERIIKSNSMGFTYVKDVFTPVTEKCDRSQKEYNYTEIGDIDVSTGNALYNVVATEDLPDNAKIMAQIGDVLVSTVRPNRGAVAILEENNRLASGAFTVLRQAADYPKEILQLLLRTKMYRDWLLKYNVGTSYPVIKDDDVLNMPLPLFDAAIIKDVVGKVAESHLLRVEAAQLLEYAKQAVEIAIEQGEDKAMEWLKEEGVDC